MRKLTKNPLIPYENQWVALTPDNKRVVAVGKTFLEAHKKLEKLGTGKKDAILTYVLPFDKAFAPQCLKEN